MLSQRPYNTYYNYVLTTKGKHAREEYSKEENLSQDIEAIRRHQMENLELKNTVAEI